MEKYFETHCHVFNKKVLSKRIINLVLPLAKIVSEKESMHDSERINNIINQIEAALKVSTKEKASDVFNILSSDYTQDFCFTPLMIDLAYVDHNEAKMNISHRIRRKLFISVLSALVSILKRRVARDAQLCKRLDNLEAMANKRDSLLYSILNVSSKVINENSYTQQIIDLESLAQKHNNVKPFFGVDPRRWYIDNEDLLQKVKQKISLPDSKFHGIKLYAPNGFSPTDPVLYGTDTDHNGIYKYCEDNRIPITIHCSNAGFACMAEVIKVNGHININGEIKKYNHEKYRFYKKFYSINISKAIEERAKVLNHPKLWKIVLDRFPNLIINFGHFGGSGQIEEYINYNIPYSKISSEEYYIMLSELDEEQQIFVESCFSKRRNNYVLKQGLLHDNVKKLWNILYYAGLIDNWSKAIFDIIRDPKYPNTFTDLSSFSEGAYINGTYTIYQPLQDFKTFFFDKLTNYEKSKFLYGSDFFLILFFGPQMSDYIKDFKNVFGNDFDLIASENPQRFLF